MSVSLQTLVQALTAHNTAGDALAFRPGQALEALVLGQSAGGMTDLKIGEQVVQALLKQALTPGTLLQLAVKSGAAAPHLVIVGQTPPQSGVPAAVLPRSTGPLPLAVVAETDGQVRVMAVASNPLTPLDVARPPTLPSAPAPNAPLVGPTPRPAIAAPGGASSRPLAPLPQSPSNAALAPNLGPANQLPPSGAVRTSPTPSAEIAPGVVTSGSSNLGEASAVTVPRVQVHAGQPASVRSPSGSDSAVSSSASPTLPFVEVATAIPRGPHVQSTPGVTPATPSPDSLVPWQMPAHAEADNALLVAQSTTRPPPTLADMPKPPPQSIGAAAPVPVSAPTSATTPGAALAQIVPDALARQASPAPLLRLLAAVMAQPTSLPAPILRAVRQVLSQLVPVDEVLDGEVLRQAIARSGVFLEANLAESRPVAGDGKSALLALRSALSDLLGGAAPPPGQIERSAPPLRGTPPRASIAEVPVLPDVPRDIARVMHGHTDAALSRTRLLQVASLPDGDPARAAIPDVRVELPFVVGGELVMAQLQITQDGPRRQIDRKRGWIMRFALNSLGTGEVGAEIGLLGAEVNVALWAAEPETAAAFNASLGELERALAALGLRPGAIRCRNGVPDVPARASGQFVDSVS